MTATYSRLHRSFQSATAKSFGLTTIHVRVLVAIHDLGGQAVRSDLIEDAIGSDSMVRRALLQLYASKLATGVGVDGRERRTGVRTVVSLTPTGRTIALAAIRNAALVALDDLKTALT